MSLTARIKTLASELGFEKVGIAPVEPLEHAGFLNTWLQEGFHGDMSYMARAPEQRADPGRLLTGARSVVVVAKNYYTGVPAPADPRLGRISRYAWGEDYHGVLKAKLGRIEAFLVAQGARAKVCVDTSAVLERLWARKAGVGWQGKHSNLLSRDLSSWFFLGEVVTDAALDPDRPHAQTFCGTCTRCIDVCPTRAIVAPYVLDARKCISYLTIEYRGPIPRELRPRMGNLIFGCDLCLEVCPWNKFAKVAHEAGFLPREGNAAPRLIELLSLTREEFTRRYRGSPVWRATYAGFLRNVCVALGNSGDLTAVSSLEKALSHEEPLVRGHAAWALGRLGAAEVLKDRRETERDEWVREEIQEVWRCDRAV